MEKSVSETSDEIVLQVLAKTKAASLVELMCLVDLPDEQVEESVKRLEQQKLVSVSSNDDAMSRIVNILDRGLRAAG